jgi:hypothetical protein
MGKGAGENSKQGKAMQNPEAFFCCCCCCFLQREKQKAPESTGLEMNSSKVNR